MALYLILLRYVNYYNIIIESILNSLVEKLNYSLVENK